MKIIKSEQQIQKEIINYLHDIGAYTFKTINSNRAGVPDIIVCINGKFIALEVKRPGGKVTPLQELELAKINKAGGKGAVIYSIEDAQSILMDFFSIGRAMQSLQTKSLYTDHITKFLGKVNLKGRG